MSFFRVIIEEIIVSLKNQKLARKSKEENGKSKPVKCE
jgi:hypothetical protein